MLFCEDENENLLSPTRIFILGASHTGKTELVKKMLVRGDFGPLDKISLLIYAPSPLTLQQKCYKQMEKKLMEVVKVEINKKTPKPENEKRKGVKRIILFDDTDDTAKLPEWYKDKFTIDSHHLNEDIINISHRIRTGSKMVRTCCDWVILCGMPKFDLADVCKTINANKDIVEKYLYDPKGIKKTKSGACRCFNHVAVKMNICINEFGKETPRYFKVSDFGVPKTMTALQKDD